MRSFRLLIALVLTFSSAAAAAQTSGSAQLTVTVTDTSGARVPDAAVILTRSNSGRASTTNADGIATFQSLPTQLHRERRAHPAADCEQMSRGVEWSVSATPTPSFVVMADVTALNAEFVEFNENLGTGIVSRAGNDVAHTPAVVFNITPMQRIGPVNVSATVRRVGERWRDTANTIRLEPYTTVTARRRASGSSEARD